VWHKLPNSRFALVHDLRVGEIEIDPKPVHTARAGRDAPLCSEGEDPINLSPGTHPTARS
jgi:hypothetical protein